MADELPRATAETGRAFHMGAEVYTTFSIKITVNDVTWEDADIAANAASSAALRAIDYPGQSLVNANTTAVNAAHVAYSATMLHRQSEVVWPGTMWTDIRAETSQDDQVVTAAKIKSTLCAKEFRSTHEYSVHEAYDYNGSPQNALEASDEHSEHASQAVDENYEIENTTETTREVAFPELKTSSQTFGYDHDLAHGRAVEVVNYNGPSRPGKDLTHQPYSLAEFYKANEANGSVSSLYLDQMQKPPGLDGSEGHDAYFVDTDYTMMAEPKTTPEATEPLGTVAPPAMVEENTGPLMDPAFTAEVARLKGWVHYDESLQDTSNLPNLPGLVNHEAGMPSSRIKFEADPNHRTLEDRYVRTALYNPTYRVQAGPALKDIQPVSVKQSFAPGKEIEPINAFYDARLNDIVYANATSNCRYTQPTQIQAYAIPAIMKSREDAMFMSQPGTGKTAAYVTSISSVILKDESHYAKFIRRCQVVQQYLANGQPLPDVAAAPFVLVITPTRELALQVFDEFRRLNYGTNLRPCVVIGGELREVQVADMSKGCDVLVATCGRLLDFLRNGSAFITLENLKYVILDEADMLTAPDDEQQLRQIMTLHVARECGNTPPRVLCFSATFPKEARAAVREYMSAPVRQIQIGGIGTLPRNITQVVVWVQDHLKVKALMDLILSLDAGRTLVFVNYDQDREQVEAELYRRGLPSCSLSSALSQKERENSLIRFRAFPTMVMVVTAVAERGLDIEGVDHVVNFDLPGTNGVTDAFTQYQHRVGRTGRMGNVGRATSFYNERWEHMAQQLTNCLVQNGQALPDFFEPLRPDGNVVDWDDESDAGDDEACELAIDEPESEALKEQLESYTA
ncbi:MAG: hypothetical protein M1828_005521 [Chrysothrix sp. TS-e1954]|nr:MAG: hypothetical protein M1828_005521 [Chrysothrix sp. TS-e1954]